MLAIYNSQLKGQLAHKIGEEKDHTPFLEWSQFWPLAMTVELYFLLDKTGTNTGGEEPTGT